MPTYDPAPGTEYPYALSDYARETARVLGPEWGAESGYLGASGIIYRTDGTSTYRLHVDHEDDLMLTPSTGEPSILVSASGLRPSTHRELHTWAAHIATHVATAH